MTAPTLTPKPAARLYPHTPGRNWRLDGNCLSTDVDMHPELRDQPGIAEAKAICAGCPVTDKCLTSAVKVGDWEGIRAGLTGPERRALAGTMADRACVDCGTTYTPRTKVQQRCSPCSHTHNHLRDRR